MDSHTALHCRDRSRTFKGGGGEGGPTCVEGASFQGESEGMLPRQKFLENLSL